MTNNLVANKKETNNEIQQLHFITKETTEKMLMLQNSASMQFQQINNDCVKSFLLMQNELKVKIDSVSTRIAEVILVQMSQADARELMEPKSHDNPLILSKIDYLERSLVEEQNLRNQLNDTIETEVRQYVIFQINQLQNISNQSVAKIESEIKEFQSTTDEVICNC